MADHRNQVEFIKKWEGGLSNDPRDIGPASHPAPCVYMGQTGWHTNKGIIYATFEAYARLGYEASCENFIAMPDYIWGKIYKLSFWDKFLLDEYRSQAIADVIVSLAWGSGLGGAYKQLAKFFNANYGTNLRATTSEYSIENAKKIRDLFQEHARTAIGEKRIHQQLLQHMQQFYISLNKPVYIKGWLNRLNALYAFTYPSLRIANEERKILIVSAVAGAVAILSIAGFLLYESENKHVRQVA
ncbi:MAG TPA: glycosyl hydrolase 108 family protein [Bacteroidia bacterium]|nr:glycosyl hydrolase 108 family protein [Bacteroidia bacterium]